MLARSVLSTSTSPLAGLFPGAGGRAPVYLSLSSSNSPPQPGSFPEGIIHFVSYDSGELVPCSLAGCVFWSDVGVCSPQMLASPELAWPLLGSSVLSKRMPHLLKRCPLFSRTFRPSRAFLHLLFTGRLLCWTSLSVLPSPRAPFLALSLLLLQS